MSETTDITELLQRKIAESQGIANLVSNRVRPDVLEQNEKLPAIRYELLASDQKHGLQGASIHVSSRVQIDSYGATRKQANLVAAKIKDLLDGFSGALEGIHVYDCTLDNRYDRRDQPSKGSSHWRYRRIQDFQISHTAPLPTLAAD